MIDRTYKKLPASRAAMRLVEAIYDVTRHFPDDEKSGLTMTLRRNVASIPTKLAACHAQTNSDDAVTTVCSIQETLCDCAAYLDVAQRLRMTARWRFRGPRRKAMKLSKRLDRMRPRVKHG